MNAYLNIIGMETLGLRMERICSNALALAQALEQLLEKPVKEKIIYSFALKEEISL